MTKTIIHAIFAVWSVCAASASPDTPSNQLADIISTLHSLDQRRNMAWNQAEEATYIDAFTQMDALLQSDPYGPLATAWYEGTLSIENVTYSPKMHLSHRASILLSRIPRDLPSEHARHFSLLVGIWANYLPFDVDVCFPQRFLAAQTTKNPSAFDQLILAALPAVTEMNRLGEYASKSRQAALLAGGNWENPIFMDDGLRSDVLSAAIIHGLNDVELLEESYFDSITGAEFAPEKVKPIVLDILEKHRENITAARPFFEWLKTAAFLNNAAIKTEICGTS